MKKKYILTISIIILIIVIALITFRHVLIGHALKVSISKKTNQNITLNIGDIDYNLLNSSVSFTNSDFVFNNTYVNKEKTIKISELKFDEIKIENLSIFSLIFHREFIAKKFIIRKPSIWFNENDNPIHFKEKPKEIVAGLKEKKDLLGNLVIIVDEFEITDGEVDMKQIIDSKEHKGSVEFQLLLKNFNTSKENILDEDRLLFAEKHFVKLSNFSYFLPNGDKISFDSTVFETVSNSLLAHNIKIEVVSGSIATKFKSINAEVNELLIGGIDMDDLESMHDINIDSIGVSDVYLNILNNDSFNSTTVPDTSKHKLNLFKVIKSFNLGVFTLNNINLLNQDVEDDTIINLDNLSFIVKNIKLDSSLLANSMPKINYKSINLSTGKLKVFEKESGLNLNLDNFTFTEDNGTLTLSGLQIDDKGSNGSNKLRSDINSIELSGISVEDLVAGNKVKVGIFLSDPVVEMDISSGYHKKRTKRNVDSDKFEITEIQISNGLIHLFEGDKLDINVAGLDINTGKIQLNDLSKIHKINTDYLKLVTSEVKINIPDKDILVTLGSMSVLNNTLTFNNISGSYKDVGKTNSTIIINKLQLGDANIDKFVSEKEIVLKYIKVIRPQFGGNLNIASDKDKNLKKKPEIKFDYKVAIGDFKLMDGNVDLNLKLKQDIIKLKSGIDITLENININSNNDTTWFKELLWKVNLSKSNIEYQDYAINCSNIELDNAQELLLLNEIEITDNESSKNRSGVDIKELSIESINLSGLKYNTIIDKQTPVVRSISISNPHFDISIDSRYQKQKNISNGQKSSRSIPFNLDEFEINDLSFIVEKKDSISISNFSLSKLDFKFDLTSDDNLVSGLNYFRVVNFLFSDTIKNSYANIGELNFRKEDMKIILSEISGGSINKHSESENYLSYSSSGFDIDGIDISKDSPHKVNLKGIDIADLQLNMVDYKAKSKPSHSSPLKKQLKLPAFLNSFSVDEISAGYIDVIHRTVTDTSDDTLILKDLGFNVGFLKVDSTSIANNDYEFAKYLSVSIRGNKFVSSDSLYETSINGIRYNFADKTLEVDSLLMKPRYKSAEFFKKAVYQTGKMDVVAGKIVCSDVRLKKLISNDGIHMGSVDVFGLDMSIFRNKKYEMNPNLYKKMPQEALLSMSKVLTIDSLKAHNAYIEYKQLSPKSLVPGEIFLNQANLSVFNINNDLKVIDSTSSMLIFFKAKLIGESDLSLKMKLSILSPEHDFWVSGHVDKIDFPKLNSMTQNLVGVTMERGTGELDIPLISGNSVHTEGSILFKYRKIKIELYDRDKAENASGLGGSMANLLLNDIFIRSNNPGFLGKTRPGEVYFKRNTQKSIVFYTWKSILSGLMSTMGYNNKEQRQEKRAILRKRK